MGEYESFLAEGQQFRIGLSEDTTQEEVQPLLHRRKGEEVLTVALQGQINCWRMTSPITKQIKEKIEKKNTDKSLGYWAFIGLGNQIDDKLMRSLKFAFLIVTTCRL